MAAENLCSRVVGDTVYYYAEERDIGGNSTVHKPFLLLPGFDEYVIGYRDRSPIIEPGRRQQISGGGGMPKGTMVLRGRVIGTWKLKKDRHYYKLTPVWFGSESESTVDKLQTAVRKLSRFLDGRIEIRP